MAKKPVYPVVGKVDLKGLKKICKAMTDEEIAVWVETAKLTVKDYGSPAINRMRQIMAIKGIYFPETVATPKAKSKYADLSLEALVAMASDASVPVEVTDNERILRMRVIMALRAHKLID